jgi:hypothetical protein
LSRNSPTNPIITNEWRLLPVSNITTPSYEPPFEQLAGPFLTINGNVNVTGYYNKVPVELTSIKNTLNAKVASNRYDVEVKGLEVTLSDSSVVKVYTDRNNRSIYLQKLQLTPDGSTAIFKFANGEFKTISKEDLNKIVTEGAAYIQSVFDWEFAKFTEIDNCINVAALKLVELRHQIQIDEEAANLENLAP